ncbi:MAG TPA: nuclear transport factor 2 family protein [Streptosporangiaceae bacterium]
MKRPGFEALGPFFRIIADGLSGLVDGEDFFDTLAEDAVFEYVVSVPGYPRRVVGREAVAELYRPYGETIDLHSADELAVHRDRDASVVVLEYAVHGHVVNSGLPYDNHFISVITIKERKIAHWRDYLDPIAVFDAIGWPTRQN